MFYQTCTIIENSLQTSNQRTVHGVHRGSTPRASPVPQESTPVKMSGGPFAAGRGRSPSQQATPSPIPGKRSPRPSSEVERFHRHDGSVVERPSTASRTPTVSSGRKPFKEVYHERPSPSPDKVCKIIFRTTSKRFSQPCIRI